MIRYRLWALWNFGKPRDVRWLRGIASLELMANPTIATYRFVDGVEVNRRSANPFADFQRAMDQMAKAAKAAGDEFLLALAKARLSDKV